MQRTRRKLRIFDVQFDIRRKLTDVTLGAQVVGAAMRTGPTMVKRMVRGALKNLEKLAGLWCPRQFTAHGLGDKTMG